MESTNVEEMGNAGRVAIVPKGTYNPEAAYKRLDMVTYRNKLYVARMDICGVEPEDGLEWMLCIETDFASVEERLSNLENPEIEQIETRENIESGDSNPTLWGKVKKFFADLKTVAFTGKYNDLEDTPGVFVKSGEGAKEGLVPSPGDTAGTQKYLREDGTWNKPPNTTYSDATDKKHGLMSAEDKEKLETIARGAQVNSITGIKGDAEDEYRKGEVNLTTSDIGALNVENVTNSTAVTVPGYAMDAMQANAAIEGTLANQVAKLNTDSIKKYILYYGNLNSTTESGVYRIGNSNNIKNCPPIDYGELLVLHAAHDSYAQIGFPIEGNLIYVRFGVLENDMVKTGNWMKVECSQL